MLNCVSTSKNFPNTNHFKGRGVLIKNYDECIVINIVKYILSSKECYLEVDSGISGLY